MEKILRIVRLNRKGNGVGCCNEKNIEVPFTLPDEEVKLTSTRRRRGLLEEILIPSKKRVKPRCRHFGECGGCRLQHLAYEDQVEWKESLISQLFSELYEVSPIISCKDQWHYRNKMEFSFSSDKKGERYLGLMMSQGRGKVLQLTECHLPNPWFVEALQKVKQWWCESGLEAFHMRSNRGSLRTLTMRHGYRTGDRMVILTVSGNPEFALNRDQIKGFVQTLQTSIEPKEPDSKLSIFLMIQQAIKGKPTEFFEMHLAGPDHIREILEIGDKKLTFHISPSAFFQTNPQQAEVLYKTALELAGVPKGASVYDLYCGTGTLGIAAAAFGAGSVVGIEISPEAILDAKANAQLNGVENVTFYCGDVPKVLQEQQLQSPDVVLVNPPRSGLDSKAIECLVNLNSPKIVYISCNPYTQFENVQELLSAGYVIKAIRPVDQFPQTVHIENIILLEKKQGNSTTEITEDTER